jgi:hypothetical protein
MGKKKDKSKIDKKMKKLKKAMKKASKTDVKVDRSDNDNPAMFDVGYFAPNPLP